jgi:hypothetical protein
MKEHSHAMDDLQIAGYLDGRLAHPERRAVESFLESDADFRQTVEAASAALLPSAAPEAAVPETLLKKAIDLYPRTPVLDLIFSLAQKALHVVHAAADFQLSRPEPVLALRRQSRGEGSLILATKKFDAVTAEVNIEKVAGGLCNIGVSVLYNATGQLAHNLRVDLAGNNRLLGSDRLRNGSVLFEEVGRGIYEITIREQRSAIATLSIQIG